MPTTTRAPGLGRMVGSKDGVLMETATFREAERSLNRFLWAGCVVPSRGNRKAWHRAAECFRCVIVSLRHYSRSKQMGTSPLDCARTVLESVPHLMRVIRQQVRTRSSPELTMPQFRALAFLGR